MRSLAGHSIPIPSPAQNVPNEISIMPTTYLRPFSGTRLERPVDDDPDRRHEQAGEDAPNAAAPMFPASSRT